MTSAWPSTSTVLPGRNGDRLLDAAFVPPAHVLLPVTIVTIPDGIHATMRRLTDEASQSFNTGAVGPTTSNSNVRNLFLRLQRVGSEIASKRLYLLGCTH